VTAFFAKYASMHACKSKSRMTTSNGFTNVIDKFVIKIILPKANEEEGKKGKNHRQA
jgi:hypothetical protein